MPDLWTSRPVLAALTETLSFLSDDDYSFEFRRMREAPQLDRYLEFPTSAESVFTPDEVVLFSGGLDSFAGALHGLPARISP
jgi:hypothetical protein